MKNTLIFSMHNIENNLSKLSRTINGSTATGREIMTSLAAIRDQIQTTTDRMKVI